MNSVALLPQQETNPGQSVVVVSGVGFTGKNLYLDKLGKMGVHNEKLALVDPDEERLRFVEGQYLGATAFTDLGQALETTADEGKDVAAVIIASSTAAHFDNLRAITKAVKDGKLPRDLRVFCEKPVTQNEVFSDVLKLLEDYPELRVSVGYILRFSDTLNALQRHLADNDLEVTGLDWTYGKDRSGDSRPTQGVFPDEVVHPLSVTDLVLARALGKIIGVDVTDAEIKRLPFAREDVQEDAHSKNPDIPRKPTSDVKATLNYSIRRDGTVVEIPVTINSSFRFEESVRQAVISVKGPNGPDSITLDFDKTIMDNNGKKTGSADTLANSKGDTIYAWSGDKAAIQVQALLGVGESRDAVTDLKGEKEIQEILSKIGRVAAGVTKPV